jgi:cysteine sulfinate desulfinase/cysteine desulfurase-like protein
MPQLRQLAIAAEDPRKLAAYGLNLDDLRNAIRPGTVLITIMHANNELGTIQSLSEIGRIAADADIYFHTDAVQSVGKIPVDVKSLQLYLLSLSGHKLYAPKGIGAFFIKGGARVRQFLYGGHHQRGFRPGTENVAGIVGLGKAAELAYISLDSDAQRISILRDKLERGLLSRIPDSRANAACAPRTKISPLGSGRGTVICPPSDANAGNATGSQRSAVSHDHQRYNGSDRTGRWKVL